MALTGAGLAWRYYFKGMARRSAAEGASLTEIPDGPVSRGGVPKAVHTALVNKYYFDHLYTGVIVKAVKGPLAKATYWSNQRIIDGVVNEAGRQSVAAGRAVYDHVDQTLIDRVIVDGSGRASDNAGEGLRTMQTGKVQQYAAILFAAATVLAGVFILVLSI